MIPIGLGLLALLFVILRKASGSKVVDFKGALEDTEEERSRIRAAWSGGTRNETLLRYYAVMQKICGRIGIKDIPSETPSEYTRRVAANLGMEFGQATRFAQVFNRARYGLELSLDETADASTFMGDFLDAIRRRVEVG